MTPPDELTYPTQFGVEVDGRGIAECWRAENQQYADCMFSAGLVKGIPPDTIYARIEGRGEEPTMIFMRSDEALAFARVIMGALWSAEMFERHPDDTVLHSEGADHDPRP